MESSIPPEYPWKPEKALWPMPSWLPPNLLTRVPGERAVTLLVEQIAACFKREEDARESAIGYVNYLRRKMVDELSDLDSR